ncbi:MAG: ABC transporter permease [Acidobacteriota bacterium]
MSTTASRPDEVLVVEAGRRPTLDLGELWRYRDLFLLLVWRDVKARYAQSVLGIGWAVVQPLVTMVVFTVVFGGLAKIDAEGKPYALFTFTALVPWTYFQGALTAAGSSLVGAQNLFTKVYFPRLVIPIAPVLAKLVDFVIAFGVLLLLAGGYALGGYAVGANLGLLALPLLIVLMMAGAAGLGMWLTALSIQYRDVKHAQSFTVQLLVYAAPVVYPTSAVPEAWRLVYALNPMVGVIEGLRAGLLGPGPLPWDLIGMSAVGAALLLVTGARYFARMEAIFADVV